MTKKAKKSSSHQIRTKRKVAQKKKKVIKRRISVKLPLNKKSPRQAAEVGINLSPKREEEPMSDGKERADLKKNLMFLKMGDLKPMPENPNVMTDAKFNHLVQEIQENGFDEPLKVVPDEDEEGKYWIVSGHWRYRAAKVLAMDEVPATIKKMNKLERLKYLVKRNNMRGFNDGPKFTKLVEEAVGQGAKMDELAQQMAFENDNEFQKALMIDKSLKGGAAKIKEPVNKEARAIENLSFVLNEIFSQYGQTIPNNFIFFMYGKKMHLMVSCDDNLAKVIDEMAQDVKRKNADIVPILTSIIGNHVMQKDGAQTNE